MTKSPVHTLGEDLSKAIAQDRVDPIRVAAKEAQRLSTWARANPKQAIAALGVGAVTVAAVLAAAWRLTFASR